jgi:type II secretory pathway pseudopilin PulG
MKLTKSTNPSRAFTLLEVILAVVIAAGLLIVAMSYYQRSADLRNQLLEESERLANIRLIMDRLNSDLRTAFAEPREGFIGGPDYLRFVHAGSPTPMNITEGALKIVTYSVVTNAQGTNAIVIGFNRTTTPLVEERLLTPNSILAASTNEPVAFNGAMDPLATNSPTARIEEPLTRAIRYVHFRYYDGSLWRDSWDGIDLPLGVEVSLGADPQAPEEIEYPFELFRRVIFLPAGRVSSVLDNLSIETPGTGGTL